MLDWLEHEHGVPNDGSNGIWYAIRLRARIAHSAEASRWRAPIHNPTFVALEHDEEDGEAARAELVRRYLAAFGPATRAEIAGWSGLKVGRFAHLLDGLPTFRDDRGRELLDLPRAPRPAADTPAPVRLLPKFDNVLLDRAARPPGRVPHARGAQERRRPADLHGRRLRRRRLARREAARRDRAVRAAPARGQARARGRGAPASKRGSGSVGGMLLGGHCSGGIKKALENAHSFGMDAVQLFAQSPRAWRFPDHDPADLEAFRARREELGIGAVSVHALYLINLASPKDDFYEKSVATLSSTVDTACAIGADVGRLPRRLAPRLGLRGRARARRARAAPRRSSAATRRPGSAWRTPPGPATRSAARWRSWPRSTTRSTATSGSASASTRATCSRPATTSPSPPSSTACSTQLDREIGLDRLRCLHVNDSKTPLGSNRDRHDNIGDGLIGDKLAVFLGHPKLQGLPALLEVPGDGHGPDAEQMKKLRALYAKATKAIRAKDRGSSARRPAARGTRG